MKPDQHIGSQRAYASGRKTATGSGPSREADFVPSIPTTTTPTSSSAVDVPRRSTSGYPRQSSNRISTTASASNTFATPRSPDLLRPESTRMQGVSQGPYRPASPSRISTAAAAVDLEQAQFRKSVQAYSDRSSVRNKYDPLRSKTDRDDGGAAPPPAPLPVSPSAQVKKSGTVSLDAFKGEYPLQYALWAHHMSLGAALLGLFCGIFAILWNSPWEFRCSVNGQLIDSRYLLNVSAPIISGETLKPYQLCNMNSPHKPSLEGSPGIGSIYIIYSVFVLVLENRDFGFGLYHRSDTVAYTRQFSPLSIMHFVFGVIGLGSYCTVLAAVPFLATSIILAVAAYRQEAGDGGRAARRAAADSAAKKQAEASVQKVISNENCLEFLMALPMRTYDRCMRYFEDIGQYNPGRFYLRLVNEGKLSSYFWTFMFLFINLVCFGVTLKNWMDAIDLINQGLLDGTLDVNCSTCNLNRQMIITGPPSSFAPWAKASAWCLHLNSMLILLPVTKTLLTRLYNTGVSFHAAQQQNNIFTKCFAGPLIRYLPLHKNIDFHKLCAGSIFFFTWIHIICHYANLVVSNDTTLVLFTMYGWSYFAYFSGAIITVAMFFIYSGAAEEVRRAKFELFFGPHHFFTIYFFFLFIHAKVNHYAQSFSNVSNGNKYLHTFYSGFLALGYLAGNALPV